MTSATEIGIILARVLSRSEYKMQFLKTHILGTQEDGPSQRPSKSYDVHYHLWNSHTGFIKLGGKVFHVGSEWTIS